MEPLPDQTGLGWHRGWWVSVPRGLCSQGGGAGVHSGPETEDRGHRGGEQREGRHACGGAGGWSLRKRKPG